MCDPYRIMKLKRPRSTRVEINLRDDPRFFMLDGITAEENADLQQRANAAVARLFRRRIRHPDKLVANFRSALRHWGFVRSKPKLWDHGVVFKATVGRKLERKLRSKHFKGKDLLYGIVTAVARRAGLDPRFEDVWVCRDGSCVEGQVNAVPFIEQGEAMDKVIAPWVKSNQGRLKPA
jgi:hypothetical protein